MHKNIRSFMLIIPNLYGYLHKSCNGIPVRAGVSHLQSLKNGSKEYIPNSR